MTTPGQIKRKNLASSVSPEANQPQNKKANQESDTCLKCKCVIKDSEECSIQCQWCQLWVHGKCSKLSDEECGILSKSGINLMYFCTTCSPNIDEALESFDDNKNNPNKQILNSSLSEEQTQLDNKLEMVETKLNEIKEELSLQLSKCREIFSTPTNIPTKPPPLIANTVVTALT